MKQFNITATHENDIYDLELKEIHVEFKKLGINAFPTQYIKAPKYSTNTQAFTHFSVGLSNTWNKRNRNAENLKVLQEALKAAQEKNK